MSHIHHRVTIQILIWGLLGVWATTLARAQEPSNRDILLLGARNAWKLHAYDRAIARYGLAITHDPEQWDAVAELGWLFLDIGHPLEAIHQFEAATTLAPNNLSLWRTTAMAYSWTSDYDAALDTYQTILERFPTNTTVQLEYNGKEALWRGHIRQATTALEQLATLEPHNSDILFDLGQLATRNDRPFDAHTHYRQLLSLLPEHRQARLALDLSTLSQRPLLTLGYTYINQHGFDNTRSITYGLASIEERLRLSDALSTSYAYDNTHFTFGSTAHTITGRWRYNPTRWLHLDGFISGLHYNGRERDHINGGIGLSYETLSGIQLGIDFERKDVWENRTTVLNGIAMNRVSTHVGGTLGRHLDWTLRGDVTNYSDHNTRLGGEFLTSYQVLWFPRTLRLIYRVNAYGFQRASSYFSPGAYATNTAAIEFQHWLGYPTHKDHLAEAPRNHYTVYYGVSVDSNAKLFHEWHGTLSYPLTQRLDMVPSLKIIRSSVYHEWNTGIFMRLTF
ncbi:tetratricopeptide repeat protein [Candidatus Methylomirabilis sp.]|uniref:tetratricopeptide repeat protein n=1 Tax=Candidatus Methylomirabilis sp. TaxID=2032687 RepID=UPI002A69167D|nr:tetratricopeptide repeat protein [Candidatus Methylomirabilis sp.]